MRNDTIIEVKDLIATYEEETILDRISFEVYEGEIFVVLGGSGSGKTTLLKHLIGLYLPRAGRIIIDGEDITNSNGEKHTAMQRKIGVLFQSGALFGSMTLGENVAMPIREYTNLSEDSVNDLVKMKLNLVNLDGYEDYLPSEVSGGMKKRAGLARAMALNPKILFFDEPSAGLDPVTSAELDNLIVHLNKSLGTTMVIVTHELQSVFTVAQRIIMLDQNTKSIIAEGDPRHLRDQSESPFVRHFLKRQTF
jgi:phospholipid/cholesterol/gamma-HCH transport system ATP-binding protein